LAISQKEEPFDVFICYKETDNKGSRTPDSVIANDLYYQLKQEGFKVFFARITLEDKLGSAYEPYIFAALNSAKVMVVLGTKPEHFNAVWVKNEWSRYLALVKKSGGKKILIPAYKDMDPYDLPEEFSHLQAQDMSKLGFMQDLIRGIKKIAKTDEPKATVKETVVVGAVNANIAPLLERAFLFLEDSKWRDANIYCEKVLDIDPKNAEAYLGKLMADLQVRSRKQLADCTEPFDDRENYGKVLRFGDEKLENEMRGYISHINERNEKARLTGIYNGAVSAMNTANSEEEYKAASDRFKSIPGFQDADALAEQCLDKAEVCRKDANYSAARSYQKTNRIDGCESAIRLYESISGWKDSDEQIYACRKKIEEIKAKEEADRLERERQAEEKRIAAEKAAKKRKITIAIVTPIIVACIVFAVLLTVIIPKQKLKQQKLEYQKKLLARAEVGSSVFFGSYEQDNDTTNGKEDIEWLVLAKEDNKMLVISKYALDGQQYDTSGDATWETCSLRKWLNGTFINNAFSPVEQSMIQTTTVTADKNSYYSTLPGNNTTDKVFLLSITEVNQLHSSDIGRHCNGTAYCLAQGVSRSDYGTCIWWLRSPGRDSSHAALVDRYGDIVDYDVQYDYVAVRPALWINLGS
nr:DUF6273 domain-containing protein [Lachnospiraceae bacterium]